MRYYVNPRFVYLFVTLYTLACDSQTNTLDLNPTSEDKKLWNGGVLVYSLKNEDFDHQEKCQIIEAAEEINHLIPNVFMKEKDEKYSGDPAIIKKTNGYCSTYVGFTPSNAEDDEKDNNILLTNACIQNRATLIHEFFHKLGAHHEMVHHGFDGQTRQDIVKPELRHNFLPNQDQFELSETFPYDQKSIMNYHDPYSYTICGTSYMGSWNELATENNQLFQELIASKCHLKNWKEEAVCRKLCATIVDKDGNPLSLDPATHLSHEDISGMNRLYEGKSSKALLQKSKYTQLTGGCGGSLHYEEPEKISTIAINSGDIVDSITINNQKFGGNGGSKRTYSLNKGEYIQSMHVSVAIYKGTPRVSGLALKTNRNKSIWGGYPHSDWRFSNYKYTIKAKNYIAPKDHYIAGFRIRSGAHIDAIGPIYECLEGKNCATEIKSQDITGLTIASGTIVDHIEIERADNSSTRYGGPQTSKRTTNLKECEYLKKISVTFANYEGQTQVRGISIITNRHTNENDTIWGGYPSWHQESPLAEIETKTYEAPDELYISDFRIKSGKYVEDIEPVYSPIQNFKGCKDQGSKT